MELKLSQENTQEGTTTLEDFQTGMALKIVVGQMDDGEYAHIFPRHILHIDMIRSLMREKGGRLLAAGAIWPPCGEQTEAIISWDSNTCREELGFDQPADPNESERIKRSVSEAVSNFIKSIKMISGCSFVIIDKRKG